MRFGPALATHPVTLRIEHCDIRVMDGNWGVFHQSFTGHVHGYHELHIVTGGSGRLLLPGLEMPLQAGCTYLLPPRTWHEQWSDPAAPLEEYHLAFDVVCGEPADAIWQRLFQDNLIRTDCPTIRNHFDRIAVETHETEYGHPDMLRLLIHMLFLDLTRIAGTTATSTLQSGARFQPDTERNPAGTRGRVDERHTAAVPDELRTLRIDHALLFRSDTITLSGLSAELNLSERQIQRAIATHYGTTFQGLKTRSRLSHAAMLLTTTAMPICRIGHEVGYANESAFSRAFRIEYGRTPSAWRRQRTGQTTP